jgi:hypothetical protein
VPARSPAMPIPARNFLSSCASMVHLLSLTVTVHGEHDRNTRSRRHPLIKKSYQHRQAMSRVSRNMVILRSLLSIKSRGKEL